MGSYIVNVKDLVPGCQLKLTTYNLSLPTFLSHLKKCAPSLLNSPSTAPLPFQGFNNKSYKNSQRTIAAFGLPEEKSLPQQTLSPGESFSWA
jgi:hypothetical protein